LEVIVKKERGISRRDFIKNSTLAAVGGPLILGEVKGGFSGSSAASSGTRIVLVRDRDMFDSAGEPRPDRVLKMLDRAVTALMNESDPGACWRRLVKKTDIVGIKSNVWRYIPTTSALEESIRKRVLEVGVPPENISVDDRGVLKNPVFKKATALINARPMRSHHWSGVGSLIKNYIMFVPRPYEYHGDSCADLASIWQLPIVKDKTRLNILVMFNPQFHGKGPHSFSPKYVWRYYGMIVGFDPVAVDSLGVRIIQAKRREFFQDDRPLEPPPKHVYLADTRHRLGTADPARIELVKLGYGEDILV
jgi:hypothetical protein